MRTTLMDRENERRRARRAEQKKEQMAGPGPIPEGTGNYSNALPAAHEFPRVNLKSLSAGESARSRETVSSLLQEQEKRLAAFGEVVVKLRDQLNSILVPDASSTSGMSRNINENASLVVHVLGSHNHQIAALTADLELIASRLTL